MQRTLFTQSSAKKGFRHSTEVSHLPPCAKPLIRVSFSIYMFEHPTVWLNYRCGDGLGANFTAYQELKKLAHRYQPDVVELPSYQHMIIGLISGAMGPFSNAPIDTIKTREYDPSSPALETDLLAKDCKKGPGSLKSLRLSE